MYIRKNIPYSNREDLAVENIELICIEVKKPKSKPLLIETWYRPPNSSIELFSDFEKFLQLVDDENKEIIITGDLNCNLLEQTRSQVTSRLLDVMDIFQLQQHIQTPTRITPTTSSLIDVIITQIGDSKTLETGAIQLGISDHSLVYLCRKISIPKEPPRIIFTRQFKNYQASLFKQELSYYLSSYVTSDDPNVLWNNFKTKFLAIAQKHAPLRQRRVKHEHKPWLTNEIKQLIFHRDYLKRQSVRVSSTDYHTAYKRCKNRVNKLIESTKKDYFKKRLTNSSNSKESWQAINELLNRKPKPTRVNQIIEDDKIITNNEDIANSFNQYFSSIGCKLSYNIRDDGTDPLSFVTPVANTFNFSPITTEEVIEALSQLNPKKAPGIDGISIRLLRDTIDVIAEPLANIFNLSLRTAIFPDDWKFAKISPIFKDGTKNECGNYRPISVISTVAKLFEGIVYHQLRSFIAANNILIDQQSGFRPKHSTETALISSTNEWLLNMDKGFVNGVLFLDLKKAFDTVNHDILLSKLELQYCLEVT